VILDERAVHDLLSMEELIPAMATAMADLSSGKVVQPGRVMLPVADHQGFLGLMPAYGSALGAKLVAFYPNNQGIPSHHAVILLFKPETGEPLVTMDGRLITEMRTAAVSAVATRLLARPEASVLGILGSGVQARSHLAAMRLVRTIRDVRVWSPRNAPAFAKEFGVRAVASAEEAVRGADIVVVATSSQTPVLSGAWLAPGTHINAVGAPRPTWRELDDEALRPRLSRAMSSSRARSSPRSARSSRAGSPGASRRTRSRSTSRSVSPSRTWCRPISSTAKRSLPGSSNRSLHKHGETTCFNCARAASAVIAISRRIRRTR
jgi:alanine dehydrogenase